MIPEYPATECMTDLDFEAWSDSLYPELPDENGACQQCGRVMLDDEPVYWTPVVDGQRDAMCEACWQADGGAAVTHAAWLAMGGWQQAERQDELAVDVDDLSAAWGRTRR